MLATNMPAAVAQALRACARSVAVTGPSNSASRVLARRTFLIAPSYKARVAVRSYATATVTATVTKTKKAPATRANKTRITAADAQRKKRSPAKKAKTKPKPKAKPKAKKAKAKKPAPKKKSRPAKQPLSPEKKALLDKRALKKTALLNREPTKEATSVWTAFVAERIKSETVSGTDHNFGDIIKRLGVEFKSISASETARLEEKILLNKATNAGNYKKWVESHSIEEIHKANLARQRLTRDHKVKTRKIADERMPKRPVSAFAHFVKARMSDHNEGNMLAAVKNISIVWKSLSPAEKRPFEDLAIAEKTRYVKDMEGTGLPTPVIAS